MSQPAAHFTIAGNTDTGLKRQHNEDYIGFDTDTGIAVLADGMGGHQAGEIASRIAVESLLNRLISIAQGDLASTGQTEALMGQVSAAVQEVNSKIFRAAETHKEQRGMGTTLVALTPVTDSVVVTHVGDSRLYLWRKENLARITTDHSLVQELIDKGFYSEEEARTASVGHVVTRALGTRAEVEVDVACHPSNPGDTWLLCSDGLSDLVADWQIEEILRETSGRLETCSERLVQTARRNGGNDNISVILVHQTPPS